MDGDLDPQIFRSPPRKKQNKETKAKAQRRSAVVLVGKELGEESRTRALGNVTLTRVTYSRAKSRAQPLLVKVTTSSSSTRITFRLDDVAHMSDKEEDAALWAATLPELRRRLQVRLAPCPLPRGT